MKSSNNHGLLRLRVYQALYVCHLYNIAKIESTEQDYIAGNTVFSTLQVRK